MNFSWKSFFLLPLGLFATVNEPLRCEWSTGYRNDRIHWHLQNPGDDSAITYVELNRDVEFWENALTFKVIHRDLSFLVRGAYGTFGRGTLFQKFSDLNFTAEQPHFEFDTSGWTADASGYFGYAVNLTADRTYKVILTPLLGFSGHFERLERNNGRPEPFESENAVGANSYTMFSHPNDLRMSWYGFFLGAGFTIEPGGRMLFNGGYTYHWVHARIHTSVEREVLLGTPAVSDQITSFSMKASEGGNLGHTGWGQVDFMLDCFWRLGVGGQIHYFSSKVFRTTLHQEVESSTGSINSDVDQNVKIRWTPISGWVQISRQF